ncbi:MAG: helix-turn-helix domain-containing protein [Gammaproteobacteria bacterium]|jgi:hypothetical protein|nr:helix-turn-helix domain-containing protein [Gammaproteobacteria bacterium]
MLMSPLSILDWLSGLMPAPALSPAAKNVGTVIALRVNGGSGDCFPSLARIAADAAMSARHVRRALGELARAGFLAIEARAGHSNVFRLRTPQDDALPRTNLSAHPGRICPPTPDESVRLTSEGTSEANLRVQPAPSGTCCAPSAAMPEDASPQTPAQGADNPPPRVSNARPIPPDWTPDADSRAWIEAQGVSLEDARPAIVEFRAWARDTQVKRASWDRTFRNNGPVKSALRRVRLDKAKHGGRPLEKATGPAYRTSIADIERLLSPAGGMLA